MLMNSAPRRLRGRAGIGATRLGLGRPERSGRTPRAAPDAGGPIGIRSVSFAVPGPISGEGIYLA